MIRNNEKKPKYKLRKLSIGVISFMCGFSIIFGNLSKTDNINVIARAYSLDNANNIDGKIFNNTVNNISDKEPSMISYKSNEGILLKAGTNFMTVESGVSMDNSTTKIISTDDIIRVMGGKPYNVANPYLLSENEKKEIMGFIKQANPEFFEGNYPEIYITNDGQVKFKDYENEKSIIINGYTYDLSNLQGEEIIKVSKYLIDQTDLCNVPISDLLSYKFVNIIDEVTNDPLKPDKKIFIDMSKYGVNKEAAIRKISELNNFDELPDGIKWAYYNNLVELLKQNGINIRYQNYSELNPNGVDMWNTDNRIVIGNNDCTNFIDMSKAEIVDLIISSNLGYYDSQGNKPMSGFNIPTSQNNTLGWGSVNYLDMSGIKEILEDIKESQAFKNPPTVKTASYLINQSQYEKNNEIKNAVILPDSVTNVTKTVMGIIPDREGSDQTAKVIVQYEDGSYKEVNVPVNVKATNKEATIQPLGGWTNPGLSILPSNLGTTPATGQGNGKVIEYTSDQWNASNNYNDFGWKPIGSKVGINKDGLNGLIAPTLSGERTLANLRYTYQDGFIPNSQANSSSGNNNSLILANYADKEAYKGVYRLVDVRGEKELSWKTSYTGFNYPNQNNDKFKVNFYDNDTKEFLGSKDIDTRFLQYSTGVLMIPRGTNTIRVELVPLYNGEEGWNSLTKYGIDKNTFRYNVLVKGFELYKTSKMVDALPNEEKVQIFRNGTAGIYNFTVKNESPQESGTNGGAQIAPYLTVGQNDPVIDGLKSGVEIKFSDGMPEGVVSDNKPTMYANGMNTQNSQFVSGATKKLELKTIDLTKAIIDRPKEINVDAYKLNYSTEAKISMRVFNTNGYIRREYTPENTPYHQDVVANSEEAAASYGNELTDKKVGNLATGRSIIVLMNKTKLTEVVNAEKLKQLNEEDYTPEAWKKYQDAIKKAEEILAEDESLANLSVDTANKLADMADQRTITNLAGTLPTILVKAPILEEQKNGDITATPAENTVKMKVNYKDGDKNISVEITKQENSKQQESDPITYSWNITNVATVEGSKPTVNNTNTPAGVSVNTDTGVMTIEKAHLNSGTNVTATDVNVGNAESKESSITVFTPATFTSTPVSYVAGRGTAELITEGVTTTETGLTGVTKEIVEVDGQETSEVPQTSGEHTVKVKVTYTKDGVTTSSIETVTVNVSPETVESNAGYFTNEADKEGIVKKAFEEANTGITINGNITVTKVDGQSASELPSTVKADGDGVYTVTVTATITKDGTSYPNQEITVKVKVVSPATFTSTPVSYVAGRGTAESITEGVTTTETGLTGVTKEIVEVDGQKTSEVPQTAGEHTVKVKVTYTKDGVTTSSIETVTVNVSPETATTINPPSVIAQNNGSVTITPQGDETTSINVGFTDNKDGVTKVSIKAIKNEQGKWSLENSFNGVEIDSDSGVITITSGTAKPNTEVTAQAETNTGDKSGVAKATVKETQNPGAVEVKPPLLKALNNGSVTIEPQGEVNKLNISFTDKNNKEVQVVADKNEQGKWTLKAQVEGVSINPDTGVVTLSSGTAKSGTEVKAKEAKDGTESDEAKVTVIDSGNPVQPEPGPIKPQEPSSSEKHEGHERREKSKKQEVVKKEKSNDNGIRYLNGRVKIVPVGESKNGEYIYKRIKYIKGYPDNTVRPNSDLTRAEVAMILARLDGLNIDDNKLPKFNDTKTDEWYNAAINEVVKKGYMKGYPDGRFLPNKKITRAELANIMVNVYSVSGNELKEFSDIKSHWAEDAIKKAYASGFVNGYADGTFKPDKFITRAEAVKMFNILYLYKVSAENILKIEESKGFKDFKDNEKKDWYYDDIVESTNDYYFTLDNKGVNLSNKGNEANINHVTVGIDDINVLKDGYDKIVRFLNNYSTK